MFMTGVLCTVCGAQVYFLYLPSISQCCLSLVVFTYLSKDSFAWVNTLLCHESYNDVTSWLTQIGTIF